MRQTVVYLLLFSAAIFAAPIHHSVHAQSKSKRYAMATAAVRTVLDAQIDAWNRGDIEGFMDGYAGSAEITFDPSC